MFESCSYIINTVDVNNGNTDIIGGWVGDGMDNFFENIKTGLISLGSWIITGFFDITSPIMDYGIKVTVVICFVVYFCSQDNRAISKGIKFLFYYLLYIMIRSVAI